MSNQINVNGVDVLTELRMAKAGFATVINNTREPHISALARDNYNRLCAVLKKVGG